jgi:OmpA-OmpF porin, OOP family
MRHLTLFAAASAVALASPAIARDGSHYVGVDAGLLMPKDIDIDFDVGSDFDIENKNGFDIDVIFGHDFGFIRAEGELAWKRADHDEYSDDDEAVNADGDTDVRSVMINLLGDVGNDQWAFYAGGGVGFARVRNLIEVDDEEETFKDSGFAWQGIAGVRFAVNEMIDVGLKYRYFDTQNMSEDDVDFDFKSHSIMLSIIYNIVRDPPAAPPPPVVMAPPPPPPPTQTCPDGSVILATDACPPPPPPPPPPPEPERG